MTFARKVIAWQRVHGRHHLPWQASRDAYSIWVSEIMLQQTQVTTVIPYYRRFMARFPDVATLSAASLDDVLAYWSGLGYYSRARNLHGAARDICERHEGRFPESFEEVAALSGIGRSTAGAIMVFAFGARHAILDGNVKRVLARVAGIAGYPGDKPVADALWRSAARFLPRTDIEKYTQGLMDLGATVCVRQQPRCDACPVTSLCIAYREDRVAELPAPRPRKALPHKATVMLILEHRGELLFEKRPAPGIWGGLWSFPELEAGADLAAACAARFGASVHAAARLPDVRHGFTHFNLTITPQRVKVNSLELRVGETDHAWLAPEAAKAAAIPAPVRRILETVNREP